MSIQQFYNIAHLGAKKIFLNHEEIFINSHPVQIQFLGKKIAAKYAWGQINDRVKVVLLGTPEAYAVTTGLINLDEGDLKIKPARMHFGSKRSQDTAIAGLHALQLPPVADFLKDKDPEELVVADLLREGQKTQAQEALFYIYDKNITNALVSIRHIKDKTTPLGRRAKLVPPNLEGVNKNKVTTLVISDSVASGTNQFYCLQYFKSKFPKLQKAIILAPHLSRYGACALAGYMKEINVEGVVVGFGALLESVPPKMYLSPTPINEPEYFVDKKHGKLMELMFGKELASKLCVAGNWSAMFLSPGAAVESFEEELVLNNTNLEAVIKRLPNLSDIKQLGLTLKELVPTSTYLDALYKNKMELLKKTLA